MIRRIVCRYSNVISAATDEPLQASILHASDRAYSPPLSRVSCTLSFGSQCLAKGREMRVASLLGWICTKSWFRARAIIFIALLGMPPVAFAYLSASMIKSIEDPEGRAILEEAWMHLARVKHPDSERRTTIYIGKESPLIHSNRIDLTYRIRTDEDLDYRRPRGPEGCRSRSCDTTEIIVTEYKMDCLSRKYQRTSKWSYVVYIDPDSFFIGGEKVRFRGAARTFDESWAPIPKQSVHEAVADALCKKVLPQPRE